MSSSPKKMKLSTDEPQPPQDKQEYHKNLKDIDDLQSQMNFMSEKINLNICKMERMTEIEKKPLYNKREEFISQIPNFWFTALTNHPLLSKLLQEQEEDIFAFMTKIEICLEDNDDMAYSWKITFCFKENPYFENDSLMKEYVFKVTGVTFSKKINVSLVSWKEGHDITEQLKERKSLFGWLISSEFHGNDLEIAQAIKDDLWINPLPFFLIGDNDPGNNRYYKSISNERKNDHNVSEPCTVIISSDENEDSDNDVIIIEDSEDEKSTAIELDDEDSDNGTDEVGSTGSNDAVIIENN